MIVPSKSSWLRHPVLEWFSGLVLGVFTAAFLVFATSMIYPSVEDYGVDFGLILNVRLKEFLKEPITPDESQPIRYVFLDVDPGGDDSSSDSSDGACRALMKHAPGVFDLRCQPTRPLNRSLLAEVLKELDRKSEKLADSRDIRAIVFDVALAEDSVINEEDKKEDKELRDAMNARKGKPPITYVADAFLPLSENDSAIQLISDQAARYPGEARIAFPVADSAIRRYHKCFKKHESTSRVESLPYSIARIVNSKLPECGRDETPPGIADDERIIYTLPSLKAHADSSLEIDKRSNLLAAMYAPVYTRCLAANLWSHASKCSLAETYQGAIVVVGASNPFRRDRHYTPLGMMSGAEVVINATRSFLLYPDQKVKSPLAKMWKKIYITFACSVVWLIFHLLHHRMAMQGDTPVLVRVRTWALNTAAFFVTLAAVVALAIWLSFDPDNSTPNLDVLLPVIAIGLETYADFSKRLVDFIKNRLTSLLEGI